MLAEPRSRANTFVNYSVNLTLVASILDEEFADSDNVWMGSFSVYRTYEIGSRAVTDM